MIDSKKLKLHVIILFSFWILQTILLTFLVKYAIIKYENKKSDGATNNGSQVEFLLGDLNMDGKVDYENDFQSLIDYVNHPDAIPSDLFKIADITCDNIVDVRDLSEFQRLYPKPKESKLQ